MSWISGSSISHGHLITVAELLQTDPPLCCAPGPAYSRCTRAEAHPQPCAALGTDGEGVPVVVTWYRPSTDSWPITPAGPAQEPGT